MSPLGYEYSPADVAQIESFLSGLRALLKAHGNAYLYLDVEPDGSGAALDVVMGESGDSFSLGATFTLGSYVDETVTFSDIEE